MMGPLQPVLSFVMLLLKRVAFLGQPAHSGRQGLWLIMTVTADIGVVFGVASSLREEFLSVVSRSPRGRVLSHFPEEETEAPGGGEGGLLQVR